MEFFSSEDVEDMNQPPGVFQTIRIETEALPPLVELGRKLLAKAQDGDAEGVRELMKRGAPFTTDWLGTSAIHWACQLNHLEVAEILLKAGISRDSRNKVDRTPLHVTAQEGHIEILKLLLDHGVDVDATDMLRMTPLHWAAEYGHEECVRLLLEHGADPVAINKFDKTPDQIAFDNNRLDITHIIQEYAENPLRHIRRKAAKEKQKQAAAAHKAALEQERIAKALPKVLGNGEKPTKQPGEIKEVRILKLPKRKLQSNLMFESPQKTNNDSDTLPVHQASDFQPSNDENTEKALAMLQAHGITMLPNDESNIVASAVQSGQKVMLTEAGKMALNLTEKPQLVMKPQQLVMKPQQLVMKPQQLVMKPQQLAMKPQSLPVKGLIKLPGLLKGKKVITIRADQLINMKNERKVIIQTDKKFKAAVMPTKPKMLETAQVKPNKVEVVVRKTLINNKPFLTSSIVQKPVNQDVNTFSSSRLTEIEEPEAITRIEEDAEKERLREELEETKKQVQYLTEQFLKKDKEAQEYKKMVELLQAK